MYHQFKELAEVDITTEPMEVGPTLHYFMGGIKVDHDTQSTNVPGLYACGECAAGLHGANRLGGNSLSDLLVFGKRAGEYASQYCKANELDSSSEQDIVAIIRKATDILNKEEGKNPFVIHEDLQKIMNNHVGIVREEKELIAGITKIEELKTDIAQVKAHPTSQYNPGWNAAIDLSNIIIASEAVAKSALIRQESRGGHTRLDFPEETEKGLEYNVVIKQGDNGEMETRKEMRSTPPEHLSKIAFSSLEDLEANNE